MNKKEADKEIYKKLARIKELVKECEVLANKYKIDFSLNVGGYGMGGWYSPVPEGEDPEATDKYGSKMYGWLASSHSC